MTRRHMLAVLGASATPAMAQGSLQFRGLDHIEFTVKDVERSVAFYAQLFGGVDVMKNRTTTRRYIKLGTSYMAIDRADAPRIDHVCVGVENFNIDAVHAYLTARGLAYRDYPSGRDTGVNDPDGTRLQLSSVDGWTSLAAQTASGEPRDVRGLFQPLELSRVEINVSNREQALAHYGKLVGGMAGLELFTGAPGFRRFRIRVETFVASDARQRLEAIGARMEEAAGAGLRFLDPDGFAVEIV